MVLVSTPGNRLLQELTPDDFKLLEPSLELVELREKRVLHFERQPITDVYFMESGLVSVLASYRVTGTTQAWLVGSEGLVGVPVLLGVDQSPHRRMVQVGGSAWRISSDKLRSALDLSSTLRDVLLRYVHSVLVQTAQTAACNARHPLAERLCRWLLMAQDRLQTQQVPVTHELLANLLGVRRSGVTVTIEQLHHSEVLGRARGSIVIRDRAKLEQYSCKCYGVQDGRAQTAAHVQVPKTA